MKCDLCEKEAIFWLTGDPPKAFCDDCLIARAAEIEASPVVPQTARNEMKTDSSIYAICRDDKGDLSLWLKHQNINLGEWSLPIVFMDDFRTLEELAELASQHPPSLKQREEIGSPHGTELVGVYELTFEDIMGQWRRFYEE